MGGEIVRCRQYLKVGLRSLGVIQGQMAYHCRMEFKLDGWSHLLILKVNSGHLRSLMVKMVYHYCIDIGGSSNQVHPCKVSPKSSKSKQPTRLASINSTHAQTQPWGSDSFLECWPVLHQVPSITNVNSFEDQFEVTRGHPRSNVLLLLHGVVWTGH